MYPDQPFQLNQPYQFVTLPPKFAVPNKKVAVEPFPNTGPATSVKGGVLVIAQRGTLQGLRVVHGNENYLTGHMVYIRAERQSNSTWAKEIYDLGDGVKFIVIPEDEIVLLDRYPETPAPTP